MNEATTGKFKISPRSQMHWGMDKVVIISGNKRIVLTRKELKALLKGAKINKLTEGTCGYGENGELGEEPAGPHLIKKEDKQDITQQMADIEKKKNISKKDKKKLEKLAKMMAKANESYSYKDMIGLNEGKKITLGDKGRKFTLDIENEAQMFLARLKKDKKKLTLKNFSDYIDAEYKFFNSPKLNQLVFNYIKKNFKKLSEATIHHSQMRIIYVPKKDIKKAMKVIKSMPFSLKGKIEVEKKPSDKVRNHFRIITTKQLFNAVVEYLATADIGVKTISKGKM
jgi:hypothetical protein